MWNVKGNDTNELMKQKEAHRLQKGDFGKVMCIAIFEIDNQQTYCMAYETRFKVMRQPGWEGALGENGYMCMYG